MIIYWLIFSFTCLIAYIGTADYRAKKKRFVQLSNEKNFEVQGNDYKGKNISVLWAVVSFSALIFFIGMRSGYGDTYTYIQNFNLFSTNTNIFEIFNSDSDQKGYDILVYLVKKYISKDYSFFLFILALFQGLTIVKLYYKYSCNYLMSAYLFIASTSFTWMMNGIRQFISVCIILYFFDYIIERKFWKFLVILAIAMLVHKTAILWLPIYFVVSFTPWSLKIWSCIAATLLLVFCINQFTDLMSDSEMQIVGYNVSNIVNYDDGVNFTRVIIAAVPVVIAFIGRKKTREINDKLINICTNLSVVSVCVYLLGVVTSGIMIGRIPIYFTLLNFVLLPWLIENIFCGKTKSIVKILCYVFYFIYFVYSFYTGAHYYQSEKLGLFVS